jgi:S-adenosylmethionine hydrolase
MYFTGLRLGIQGVAETATGNGSGCSHMYKYKLKNKNASIKVEAIDTFGNVYTETKITEGTDYSITKN